LIVKKQPPLIWFDNVYGLVTLEVFEALVERTGVARRLPDIIRDQPLKHRELINVPNVKLPPKEAK
jgi:hypothetical protein